MLSIASIPPLGPAMVVIFDGGPGISEGFLAAMPLIPPIIPIPPPMPPLLMASADFPDVCEDFFIVLPDPI
jgi:hypothetical protein